MVSGAKHLLVELGSRAIGTRLRVAINGSQALGPPRAVQSSIYPVRLKLWSKGQRVKLRRPTISGSRGAGVIALIVTSGSLVFGPRATRTGSGRHLVIAGHPVVACLYLAIGITHGYVVERCMRHATDVPTSPFLQAFASHRASVSITTIFTRISGCVLVPDITTLETTMTDTAPGTVTAQPLLDTPTDVDTTLCLPTTVGNIVAEEWTSMIGCGMITSIELSAMPACDPRAHVTRRRNHVAEWLVKKETRDSHVARLGRPSVANHARSHEILEISETKGEMREQRPDAVVLEVVESLRSLSARMPLQIAATRKVLDLPLAAFNREEL